MPRVASTVARALALVAPVLAAIALVACEDEKKPAMPPAPPGAGYSDVRVLSHKDCEALGDRLLEIAVEETLVTDGGSPASLDASSKLEVEAGVRRKMRAQVDQWIEKSCVGRKLPSSVYRCMRDATTLAGFDACAAEPDAGPDADILDTPAG
jgi:hypothetical protein